jgi:hypothetical protein
VEYDISAGWRKDKKAHTFGGKRIDRFSGDAPPWKKDVISGFETI